MPQNIVDPNAPGSGGQFNDPNVWQYDPQYGQVGANKGAGYNPDYWSTRGGYDAFKAGRRAYRANYQPGGAGYDKYMRTYATIAAFHPQNHQQLGQLLNQMGYYDQPEQGRSMYRMVNMDFDNGLSGNDQYNLGAGTKLNVGTSDRTADWQPMTASDWAGVNRGFYGRIDDMFGAPRFQQWNRQGTAATQLGPGGYYWNNGTAYDHSGWIVDPRTGRRTGGGYMPGMDPYFYPQAG